MKRHQADNVSAAALEYLAAQPEKLNAFLTASGLAPDDLLAGMEDTVIRLYALNFIASDEGMAREFSENHGLKPGAIQSSLALLDPHGSSAW